MPGSFPSQPWGTCGPKERSTGSILALRNNPWCCVLPSLSPVPALRVFYGFLLQSLRVISQKFMASGLTHSICSPKLGSVEKSIRRAGLLPDEHRTEVWQIKQKAPAPLTRPLRGPFPAGLPECDDVTGVGVWSSTPAPAQENLEPERHLAFSVGPRFLS